MILEISYDDMDAAGAILAHSGPAVSPMDETEPRSAFKADANSELGMNATVVGSI